MTTPSEQCPGRLEVTYDHSHGGWSSDCDVSVEVDCPERACHFYDHGAPRRSITLDDLLALQAQHDRKAGDDRG